MIFLTYVFLRHPYRTIILFTIEKSLENPNGKHVTSTFCFLKFIVKTLSCKNLIKYKLIMTYPKYIISLTYMYNYQIKAR